jgi:hypothetical protein
MRPAAALGLGFALMGGGAASAQAPASPPRVPSGIVLHKPIDCTIGETCWIAQYPDLASGPAVVDPFCGPRSYDKHSGVDIAVRDLADAPDVRAAAAGMVVAVRDGEPDRLATESSPAPEGKECGNGVRMDHAGGWSTQYCHMREGSIRVHVGDEVAAGAPIGRVGYSGAAGFPHLHVTVRKDGVAIDPFTSRPLDAGCGEGVSLWSPDAKIAYEPMTLSRVGFALEPPTQDAAVAGAYRALSAHTDTPVLAAWGEAWGVREGDKLTVTLHGPDGAVVASHVDVAPRAQARRFAFAGKKQPAGGWPAGVYEAEATLERSGLAGGPLRRVERLEVR